MRYRKQDANGDFTFGHGSGDFFVNEAATVAQAIKTRLLLWLGEYFVDTTVGMPWQTQVLGYHPPDVYDAAIRATIQETPGFAKFINYNSSLNKVTRGLSVNSVVTTIYSGVPVTISLPLYGWGLGGYGEGPYGAPLPGSPGFGG
jgi:hypothetical protein